MDAVGADQNVAMGGGALCPGAIEEIGGDAGFILVESAEAMAGMDARFANALSHGLVDHALEPAAVNRKLRHIISRVEPARLAPNLLAEAVGVEEFKSADRDRVEALQEPERGELLDGMRQRIDANAELADLLRLLEHLALHAARMQHQRGGEPADAAACDDRFHVSEAGYRRSDVSR